MFLKLTGSIKIPHPVKVNENKNYVQHIGLEFGYIELQLFIRQGFILYDFEPFCLGTVPLDDRPAWGPSNLPEVNEHLETLSAQNDLQRFLDKLDRYFDMLFLCNTFCIFDNRKIQIAIGWKSNSLDTVHYSNSLRNLPHIKRTRNRFQFLRSFGPQFRVGNFEIFKNLKNFKISKWSKNEN